jgi:adenylate cyclase
VSIHLTGTIVVDDEQNILNALNRLLHRKGYRVYRANGGKEGLDILEEKPIDLIISDMRMPGMDGAEFLTKVAKKWPDTIRILLTGYSDMKAAVVAINQGQIYHYLNKPWEDNHLLLTIQRGLEQRFFLQERESLYNTIEEQNKSLNELNAGLEKKVEERTKDLRSTANKLQQALSDLKRGYRDAVKVFSNLIELHEGHNSGHSRRVSELSLKLADSFKFSNRERQDLNFAALLHKIGLLVLPDELQRKPLTKMKAAEKEQYKQHPETGQTIFMGLEPLHDAADIIGAMHSHYDGSGYPKGLKKSEISLQSSILAVANDFQLLRNGMITGVQMDQEVACKYIQELSGTIYHPDVVTALEKSLRAKPLPTLGPASVSSSDRLKEGDVVAQDLYTHGGMLLLTEGMKLTSRFIERVQNFEQKEAKAKYEIHVSQVR